MRKMLEELFYGNINPNERAFIRNTDFDRAMRTLSENEDKLTELLDGKEKRLFLDLVNAQSEVNGTTQTVEIYFNFVGRYIPPHFGEVALTAEEQEELRKKEERKDRLHQNYLRRKANGKQREYEERTKSEKRKKMEEKKAALRAEDMAKGVYVLTSSLPHLEPQLAANSTRTATL